MEEVNHAFEREAVETWPFLFLIVLKVKMDPLREINRLYYGTILTIKEADYMLWFGIALLLIGVFLMGKSSN